MYRPIAASVAMALLVVATIDAAAQVIAIDAVYADATVVSDKRDDLGDLGRTQMSTHRGHDGPEVAEVHASGVQGALVGAQIVEETSNREQLRNDDRKNLLTSAYLGTAVDNFAGSEVLTYLNPEAAGPTERRLIAGFNFEFRLTGDRDKPIRTVSSRRCRPRLACGCRS